MNTNKYLRISILVGIFLLPFLPLIVAQGLPPFGAYMKSGNLFGYIWNVFTNFPWAGSFFPFITGKNFAFRIIVEVITGLWLILALRDQSFLPKKSVLLKAFAIFLGVIFISDLLSPNVFKSFWSNYERMEGWVTLVHLFALFVVMSSVMTRRLWEWLFRTSIGVSLILFVYGCLQLAGKLEIHQGATRIDATIGNSAYLGGYMLIHVFLALYLLFSDIRKYWHSKNFNPTWPIIYGFAVLADIFILFETATRGAQIGLIAGLFCVAVCLTIFEKESKVLRWTGGGILITLALFGSIFIGIRKSDFVTQNAPLSRLGSFVDQVLTFDTKTICEGELKSRCLLWPTALQGVKERPIFGWGQESFNYVFNKYYDPRMYAQEQWFDRTHNVFLDWLIAGGILGLLSYLSLFGFAFYQLWKKGGAFSFMEKSLITGLLVGYFFHNLTVFDNLTSYLLFVMLLAWINGSNDQVSTKLSEKLSIIDSGTRDRILIPVIAIATLFIVYKVNVPSIVASTELIKALTPQSAGPSANLEHFKKAFSYGGLGDSEIREQLVQITMQTINATSPDPNIQKSFFDLAREQMEIQAKLTPDDARYALFRGSMLVGFGDYDNAISILNKAQELSPKKQTILFSLGSAYLSKGDLGNGLTVMKKAFDLDPSFEEARKLYALALIYNRQNPLADEILKPLKPEKVLGDQRLVLAYFNAKYYEKALAGLNYLIEGNPTNIQYYYSRAKVEVALGKTTSAINDLKKIGQINPALKAEVDKLVEKVRTGGEF